MLLINDLESMLLERPVGALTAKNYLRSIRFFGEFLGRVAMRSDLVERQVNQFLAGVARGKSALTVLGHRRSLTTIWNWLAGQDLVSPYDPRRLRKIAIVVEPPRPFTLAQVRQLLNAANQIDHPCQHGTASEMLRALIWVAYESGLRCSDLRRLTPADVQRDVITIVQHKTGKPHSFRLSPTARRALEPVLKAKNKTIFPASKFAIDRWGKRLFFQAQKIGFNRTPRQGLGSLRKTHATEVCRNHGLESAAHALGHVSGTTIARRFYVEPDAISAAPPPPPILE